MFSAKVSGLKEIAEKIDKYSKELGNKVDEALSLGVIKMSADAKSRCPIGNSGHLLATIRTNTSTRFEKSIAVGAPYAAFVEFGTGSKVFDSVSGFAYTDEMKEYAKEFYVNGKGKQRAIPFLFPAYEQGKKDILKEIRKILLDV